MKMHSSGTRDKKKQGKIWLEKKELGWGLLFCGVLEVFLKPYELLSTETGFPKKLHNLHTLKYFKFSWQAPAPGLTGLAFKKINAK